MYNFMSTTRVQVPGVNVQVLDRSSKLYSPQPQYQKSSRYWLLLVNEYPNYQEQYMQYNFISNAIYDAYHKVPRQLN